jgi:hypothetical protein
LAATLNERRTKHRFSLRLPVEVVLADSQRLTGLTRDISENGVYFFAGKQIDAPEFMELLLAFPPEITWTETRKMRCRARVVRVDQTQSGTGIAAAIESHEWVDRTDSTYPFAIVRTPSTR